HRTEDLARAQSGNEPGQTPINFVDGRPDFRRIRTMRMTRVVGVAEVKREEGGPASDRQIEPLQNLIDAFIIRYFFIIGLPVGWTFTHDFRFRARVKHGAGFLSLPLRRDPDRLTPPPATFLNLLSITQRENFLEPGVVDVVLDDPVVLWIEPGRDCVVIRKSLTGKRRSHPPRTYARMCQLI